MREIKTGLRIDMNGNIVSQAKRFTDQVNKFTNAGRSGIKALGLEANKAATNIDRFKHKSEGAITDVSALNAVVTQLDHGLLRLDQALTLNTNALDRFQNRLRATDNVATRSSRNFAQFGTRMSRLATGVGVGVTIAATAIASADMDLEKAMLQLKSNLKSGAKDADDLNQQLESVRETAVELSKISSFSIADSVLQLNQLLKSGVEYKFITGNGGAGQAAAGLAKLGGLAPEEAAGFLGSLGKAFSLKTKEDYFSLADRIVKADDASAMNSGQILYNVKQGAANAATLPIDPKKLIDMNAYLDALGEEAGTSINRFLESLAGVTKERRKAIAHMGLDFWRKDKKGVHLKDIDDVITIIRNKFRNMKDEREKLQLAHKFAGEEGARAVLFFASKDQSFADFERTVGSSTGMMDKLKIQPEGLDGAFKRLESTIIDLADKAIEPFRDKLTNSVNALDKFIGTQFGPSAPHPIYGPKGEDANHPQKGWGRVWDIIKGEDERLYKQSYSPSNSTVDGKVRVEIVSQVPVKVTSLHATSGQIDVNTKRAGAHFA